MDPFGNTKKNAGKVQRCIIPRNKICADRKILTMESVQKKSFGYNLSTKYPHKLVEWG
jgi:hypothetical protein